MPTYDYICAACGHRLELFQSMSEAPTKKCPACGKSRLERQIGTGAGFIFRGAGFYLTDYRSESYKQGQESSEGGASKGEPGSSGAAATAGSGESKADAAAPPSSGKAGGTAGAPPASPSGTSGQGSGSKPGPAAPKGPASKPKGGGKAGR